MSTKINVAHGDWGHLYTDCFDEEHVYLELRGIHFEATPDGVTLQIPLPLWGFLRRRPVKPGDGLVDASDEQLREMVAALIATDEAEAAREGLLGAMAKVRLECEDAESRMQDLQQARDRQRRQREAMAAYERASDSGVEFG